jgi:hypothetical protein
MGVVSDLRRRVRWTSHVAHFLVQTEGLGALISRTAATSGLRRPAAPEPVGWTSPARVPASAVAAAGWPTSVQVVVGPGGSDSSRVAQLQRLGIPVQVSAQGALELRNTLQLSSTLVILGPAAWPAPPVLAEARRLRQAVILDLAAADLAHPGLTDALRQCSEVVVASAQAVPGTGQAHVIPHDADDQLRDFIEAIRVAP